MELHYIENLGLLESSWIRLFNCINLLELIKILLQFSALLINNWLIKINLSHVQWIVTLSINTPNYKYFLLVYYRYVIRYWKSVYLQAFCFFPSVIIKVKHPDVLKEEDLLLETLWRNNIISASVQDKHIHIQSIVIHSMIKSWPWQCLILMIKNFLPFQFLAADF